MPLEQERFFALVTETLAAYTKTPTTPELGAWWGACRGFLYADCERALDAHVKGEDGHKAPRPIDVKRALGSGVQAGVRCSAYGCQYPGVFSDATTGGGNWWCPFHREERSGPIADQIANASHEVPYDVARLRRSERLARGPDGNPAKIGPPGLVNTAHATALRHGNKPWRRREERIPDPRPGTNLDAEEAA